MELLSSVLRHDRIPPESELAIRLGVAAYLHGRSGIWESDGEFSDLLAWAKQYVAGDSDQHLRDLLAEWAKRTGWERLPYRIPEPDVPCAPGKGLIQSLLEAHKFPKGDDWREAIEFLCVYSSPDFIFEFLYYPVFVRGNLHTFNMDPTEWGVPHHRFRSYDKLLELEEELFDG